MKVDNIWQKALFALEKGDFTMLREMVGGQCAFDEQIIEWHKNGKFDNEPKMLAEALTCSCMLGQIETVCYLLDKGVDPLAGVKTGLNGFHFAASGGRLEIINLLIERKVPMEIKNMYGGTVLGQALWSAVNEHTESHAATIDALIEAGAEIENGTLEWWERQNVPSAETKELVLNAIRRREMLDIVERVREGGDKFELGKQLRELGEFERRMNGKRVNAIAHYIEAVELLRGCHDRSRLAHTIRHLGNIYHEDGDLETAASLLQEALEIYHNYGDDQSLDYANALRSRAVLEMDRQNNEAALPLLFEAQGLYRLHGVRHGIDEMTRKITDIEKAR